MHACLFYVLTEHSPYCKPVNESKYTQERKQPQKKLISSSSEVQLALFINTSKSAVNLFVFSNMSLDENSFQCDAHQLNTPVPPLDINAQQKFDTKDGHRNKSLSQMSNGPRWRQNQCLRILSDSFLESMWPNRGTKRDTSLSSFPVSKNEWRQFFELNTFLYSIEFIGGS